MRTPLIPVLFSFAATLAAQNYVVLPATANPASELNNYSLLPFMQPNARVQMFYDATEVGGAPFVADQLSMRFDGPIPQVGAPGPFSITRLQIRVGTTTVAMPGSTFADNLSQPLTTVFDSAVTYYPDNGSMFPHPWGAPNGSLTFDFATPVPIAVAAGEWLVVELLMEGNNIAGFGFSHAIVDGASTSGGLANGSAAAYGSGCSIDGVAPPASSATSGSYGPGAVHFLTGQNLGANTVAVGVFGFAQTFPGVPLPGTSCDVLTSSDVLIPVLTDANGAITGSQLALSLPADPAISGLSLFEQLASLVPGANPFDLVLSNAQAITLGSWAPLGRGTYTVAHDTVANATYANVVRPFGYALRFRAQ